jgi:hypothetical protein
VGATSVVETVPAAVGVRLSWVASAVGVGVINPMAATVCTYMAVDVPHSCIRLKLADWVALLVPAAVGVPSSLGCAADRSQALNNNVAANTMAIIMITFFDILSSADIAWKWISK